MNGRVYDPALGRFTSADPLIDGVFNSQGWNRYAYVHNRPLSATDPSGYESEEIFVYGRRVRGAVFTGGFIAGGGGIAAADEPTEFEVLVEATRLRDKRAAVGGGAPASGQPQSQQPTQQCARPPADRSPGDKFADAVVGFGDAFLVPILARNMFDISGDIDYESDAYAGGMIAGTLWGSSTIAVRGAAAVGGTRIGHALNHNPYVRIGPGRMPATGNGLPAGTHVPRVSVGGPGGTHIDLRSRLPHLPPVGALAGGDDGC
jgi:hypothetical protein